MCGIAGIFNRYGKLIRGTEIIKMLNAMYNRYDGRGAGFAAYGIYPKYKDCYALHIYVENEEIKEQVEEFLKEKVEIIKDEEIPTRNVKEIPKKYITWRYFVKPPKNLKKDEDDYMIDIVMYINDYIDGAFVASSGKNMGVFKAVGYPWHVAKFFKIDKYNAYCWLGHGRFPTNTPGWWGGAHPFNILNWSVVHNGEISSYGTNKRYVEMYGYKCRLLTDTEVVAYLFDLLYRKHKLPLEIVCKILAPPFWKNIDKMSNEERELYTALRMVYGSAMLNGPFAIIVSNGEFIVGLNDRIKLRPLVAARDEENTYIASEEAAIREVVSNPDYIYAPIAGEPVIAKLEKEVLVELLGVEK